jgi:hypothetical protein
LHDAGSESIGVSLVTGTTRFNRLFVLVMPAVFLSLLLSDLTYSGGGLVLRNYSCIIEIFLYSAQLTAYQPHTRGNEQFCQQLPDTGETLFVLDYLHPSLKEVPVSLRIIREVTGQGEYVKVKHIEELEDIDSHTVFYQPPVIRPDASFQAEFELLDPGPYIGVVTVGHPSSDATYTAVFPFEVGGSDIKLLIPVIALFLVIGVVSLIRLQRGRKISKQHKVGT